MLKSRISLKLGTIAARGETFILDKKWGRNIEFHGIYKDPP